MIKLICFLTGLLPSIIVIGIYYFRYKALKKEWYNKGIEYCFKFIQDNTNRSETRSIAPALKRCHKIAIRK